MYRLDSLCTKRCKKDCVFKDRSWLCTNKCRVCTTCAEVCTNLCSVHQHVRGCAPTCARVCTSLCKVCTNKGRGVCERVH